MIDQYLKSAICGYWRCGATMEQICYLTGLSGWKSDSYRIENVINEYKKIVGE